MSVGYKWLLQCNKRLMLKRLYLKEIDHFTLQLLMFVTAEKERPLFIIFFLSSFCQMSSQFEARIS